MMNTKRPESNENLTFNYKTFNEYMEKIGGKLYYEGEGADKKINEDIFVTKTTQIIDYLANPAIIKKNLDVTIDLTNDFYDLNKPGNENLF